MSVVPKYPNLVVQTPNEIWAEKEPSKGDHIRVNRGIYNHHGIYVSHDEVIHFTGQDNDNILDWSKNEVITTNLDVFLKDGILEVKEYTEEEIKDLYPAEHIVQYARCCIGDNGYNLIFNNCEHFSNVCTLGRFRSVQIDKIFNTILNKDCNTIRSTESMGLLGKIGGFIGGLFGGKSSVGGSRSSTTTTYEPDKVKIAEIERDLKINLVHMEQEKINLIRDVKLDVLEKEYYFKLAHEEAKARGLSCIAQTIVAMQSKLDEITEKRLEIIEKGSLALNKDIERFYGELADKIKADNLDYQANKFPMLLGIMEGFEKGSDSYNMYKNMIEKDAAIQTEIMFKQLEGVSSRQNQIIAGFLKSKEKTIEQTGQITSGIIENMALSYGDTISLNQDKNLLENDQKKLLLEDSMI